MDWFTYLAMRAFWAVLARLPVRGVVFFARSVGKVGWWLAPRYRRLVIRNLSTAFGDTVSAADKAKIGREHFASLAANIAAGACLSRIPANRLTDWVAIEGLENLREAQAKGKGAIGLLAHLGNWELLARLSPGVFQCPCGSIYQGLSNPYVDAWVRRERAAEGLELFERKEGFHGAMNVLRRGGIVGVLADQHAGDPGLWCPFFNRLASTSPLIATMALRTGAAVLGIALYTEPKGRWRLVIRPEVCPKLAETPAFTAQLNGELEAMIRRAPADWLWSHNRWKTPKPRFLGIGGKRGVVSSTNLQPFRLLIRSVNWLGDAVMTVPAIRAIRKTRPDLEITVACQEKLAEFWKAVPEVNHVLALPKGSGIFAAASLFKKGSFDAALVLPNSLRTGLEVWLARIPRRVGYAGHSRAWCLNQVPAEKRATSNASETLRHQVHDYLDIAEFIGAQRLEESDWVAERTALPVAGGARPWRIAVCPGAEFGAAKRWFPERFAAVMRDVSEKKFVQWVLVGVAKDAPAGAEIVAATNGVNVENAIGRTGLAELIEILKKCDLLLTNDTGTMHLAAMLGLPLVAVFGSTEPLLTGPLGPRKMIVQHRVPCGPCFRRECHLDFSCMLGVESAVVAEHVLELLVHPLSVEKGSPL
jgi:heptosyltransferase II